MVKLLFLLFAPLPALAAVSLGYWLRHPAAADARDAAIMCPVFTGLWIASVVFGLRWRRGATEPLRTTLLAVMIGGGALGAIVLAMVLLGVLR